MNRLKVLLEQMVSPVSHLLRMSSPSAVARFVVAVVVDAIKRQFIGPVAHIRQEVVEDQPALTNNNPATAVIRPGLAPEIETTGLHGLPGSIGWGAVTTMIMSMPQRSSPWKNYRRIAMRVPAGIVEATKTACFMGASTAGHGASAPTWQQRLQGIAVFVPAAIMKIAPSPRNFGLLTIGDGAGGRLDAHRKLTPFGVMPPDVFASRGLSVISIIAGRAGARD